MWDTSREQGSLPHCWGISSWLTNQALPGSLIPCSQARPCTDKGQCLVSRVPGDQAGRFQEAQRVGCLGPRPGKIRSKPGSALEAMLQPWLIHSR